MLFSGGLGAAMQQFYPANFRDALAMADGITRARHPQQWRWASQTGASFYSERMVGIETTRG
jgi:hypothetical protein